MAQLTEDTAHKTRNLPISNELRELLIGAADLSQVDLIRVISGGQCAKGTCTRRTGSTRHDLGRAADLQLVVNGSTIRFTDAAGLPIFTRFVTACAAAGATGIGAGVNYMGEATIHVGFGKRAVWGGTGRNPPPPPEWLVAASKAGWETSLFSLPITGGDDLASDEEEDEEDHPDSPSSTQPDG